MPLTVALTGASGFIGGVLARRLRESGWHVRALVRSPHQAQHLQELGIDSVQGHLGNPASLLPLVRDCVGVVHCAGAIRGIRREDFYQTNVLGVSHLIKACLAQSPPPRFVLLSSLAAREPSLSPYAWSKHEGESVLVREAGAMEWSIFRPPAVYGPQERSLYPLLKLLHQGIGLQLGPSHARFSLIYVDDLAEAVMKWLEKGAPHSQIFELDDGCPGGYTWDELFRRSNPRLRVRMAIPPAVLTFCAKSNELFSRLFGYVPLFTRGKVAELLHDDWVGDNSQVTQTLGWSPRISLEEGLRRVLTSDSLTLSAKK